MLRKWRFEQRNGFLIKKTCTIFKIIQVIFKCLKIHELNIIEDNKKRLERKACERYQILPKEEKETIWL